MRVSCPPRRRGKEFVKFLPPWEKELPPEQDVPVILDHDGTHNRAAVERGRKPKKRRRFPFPFTPPSSSWLPQGERLFALLRERMIRRGAFGSVPAREPAIYEWWAHCTHEPQPFVWKATADVILEKVRRCQELAGTAHSRLCDRSSQ